MINVDPLRPYLSAIKAGAALLALLIAFIGGCNHGSNKWQGKYEDEAKAREHDQIEHEELVQFFADKTAAAEAAAKAASENAEADRKAASKRYEEAKNEANRNAAALAAALRAGKQRLSETWACPAAGSAAGGPASSAGQAGTARQFDSAARIVAAADADAAAMTWLWDSWMTDRKAVIAAGCAVEAP